jgi:inhibitor of KinA
MPDAAIFTIYSLSERAITLQFGQHISEEIWQQVNHFNALINQQSFPGFISSVPAYTTLTLFYDAVVVSRSNLPGIDCFEKISGWLNELKEVLTDDKLAESDIVTIPVYYGGGYGPDLDELARLHQLTTHEVINLHSKAVYKVYMIGFVPGFAYLGGMDAALATPRKAIPRKAVPAGSVGIAGEQTGIYPLQTPGGWQIIGRTPLALFDASRLQPSLLKAGDRIIFEPADSKYFKA